MTPDIRPSPSPGSRIYSKEETLPPNQGITPRVGLLASGGKKKLIVFSFKFPLCKA